MKFIAKKYLSAVARRKEYLIIQQAKYPSSVKLLSTSIFSKRKSIECN